MEIMHNHIDLFGSEGYVNLPEAYSQINDRVKQGQKIGVMEYHKLHVTMINSKKLNSEGKEVGMATSELPSPNAFPLFNRNKESKMYLTQLPVPSKEKTSQVKEMVKLVLRKYGPQHLEEPRPESVWALGSSLYSDGHVPVKDFVKPQRTWTDSWTYQKFHTDAMTEREVWLPPKAYKLTSSWWHFFLEPVIRRIPWIVGNENIASVRRDTMKRFKPCTKIDLKGFGMQFPREYIEAAMDALIEVYPSEEAKEYRSTSLKLFNKMSIRMPDGTHVAPVRGVGLGYFSNVMTLVVGSLLAEYDIVKMFNDDILCPTEYAEKAIQKLISFDFVINEKKTGAKWNKVVLFAGVLMMPNGNAKFYDAQGKRCAVHTARYHFQRKAIMHSTYFRRRWLTNYHYERIYGYEIQPLEAFLHPTVLGNDLHAAKPVGWVKGGLLRQYRTPSTVDENKRRLWSITYPWKEDIDKVSFNKLRKEKRYLKDVVSYTEYYDYLNPEVRTKDGLPLPRDLSIGKYQLPKWADMQSIIGSAVTTGRTTKGKHPKLAAYHMLDYLLSDDPIQAWLMGGYEIETSFSRIPGVDPDTNLLYTRLKLCGKYTYPSVNKTEGEGSLLYMKEGSGLEFMQNHESSNLEFTFENNIIDDFIQDEELEVLADDEEPDIPDFVDSDEEEIFGGESEDETSYW